MAIGRTRNFIERDVAGKHVVQRTVWIGVRDLTPTHRTAQVNLSHRWSINGEYILNDINISPCGDLNEKNNVSTR